MSRYSSAYSEFVERLEEIFAIAAIGRTFSQPTQADLERSNALGRAGVVLLSSHIEGFIKLLGTLAVNRIGERTVPKTSLACEFKYHLSRDLIRNINASTEASRNVTAIDSFLKRDLHIWDMSANFVEPLPVDQFIGSFSTPKHSNIGRFFRRFGFEDFEGQLAVHLKSNFPACRNMVDHVVDQRNQIAHGNYGVSVTPNELQGMCDLVKVYCRNTDQVVGNWFRSKGCPIR